MRGGGDSVELIDWSMFDLEGNPYDTFRFESGCFAGPVHKARWMGKLLILFIEYYKQWNTTIFVTFLDASKAFDRIDHWLLFKKLIDKHVPLFIIRLLVCWYSTQKMHIRWENTVTTSFLISNGVKQGGIISPILLNLYMDQLSEKLNASNIGGDIGGKLVNHLCYADNICLIGLSSVGMQQLLSICDICAKEHDLLYNGGKSYSLCFKPKCSTFNRPNFTLNHLNMPNVNQSKYLGIVINETNCNPDLKRQMCKLYANINMLIRKILLTDSRSNKYSSKIEDTRHIHTTYILLQIKYNNIYYTKKEVHSHTQL